MSFDLSLLNVLPYKPWRWTTPPVLGPLGEVVTDGVKQTLNGVFILFSEELVTILKEGLTATEKAELDSYVNRYTEAQCAEWHVSVWAGQSSAVYCRIPATVWNDPNTPPPAKVKRFFAALWREATT